MKRRRFLSAKINLMEFWSQLDYKIWDLKTKPTRFCHWLDFGLGQSTKTTRRKLMNKQSKIVKWGQIIVKLSVINTKNNSNSSQCCLVSEHQKGEPTYNPRHEKAQHMWVHICMFLFYDTFIWINQFICDCSKLLFIFN